MDGSTKVSRLAATRAGGALLAAAALSIGAAACGSSSSSDPTGSASTAPVKKEAGVRGIRLDVVNRDQAPVAVSICADGNCRKPAQLQPGESVNMAADQVDGSVRYQDGYRVDFVAQNPVIGQPSISLSGTDGSQSRRELPLDELESQSTSLDGYQYVASRDDDQTDYKILRLLVMGRS